MSGKKKKKTGGGPLDEKALLDRFSAGVVEEPSLEDELRRRYYQFKNNILMETPITNG